MILIKCAKCHVEFGTSACSGSIFCDNCNGVNDAKQQEELRWQSLTLEQKVEELKLRLDARDNQINIRNRIIG